jgi:hypothetical protein
VRNKANKRQTDKQTESGQAKTINLLSAAVVLTLYSLQTLLSTKKKKKCKNPKSKKIDLLVFSLSYQLIVL